MFIGVITGSKQYDPRVASYKGLLWFESLDDVAIFISKKTADGLFIHELYNQEIQAKTDFTIDYEIDRERVIKVRINTLSDTLYTITRDAFDLYKPWEIEQHFVSDN